MDDRKIKSGVTSRMNKCKGEFHRWIIDEWTKIKCPYVILFFKLGGSNYMRLWENKCGKQFIVFDIGRISKRWEVQVGDKRRRNG